jgi:hypothetical protein
MGNFALSRSTLRTHGSRYGGGSAGPPFLVCALFIGLSIISISYYSLSSQYTQLERRTAELIKQQNVLQDQLLVQQKVIKDTDAQLHAKSKELEQQFALNVSLLNATFDHKQFNLIFCILRPIN